MRIVLFSLLLACLLPWLDNATQVYSAAPPLPLRLVDLLVEERYDEYHRPRLLAMGDKMFPTYEKILATVQIRHEAKERIFLLIGEVKADRRQFIEPALNHLGSQNLPVKIAALELLAKIGTPAEAAAVVALLSSRDPKIASAAATTLVALGGPRELIAMDVWLNGGDHPNNVELRLHVKKSREALKQKLDKERDHP
jgi:hypothetical protein